ANLKKLPDLKNVRWMKFKIQHAKKESQKVLESEYKELLKLRKAADEIQAELILKEDALVQKLKKLGTNLKPAAPDDREMFLNAFKTRLHHQMALKKFYDNEAVIDLAKKIPQLKKALYTVRDVRVDRATLNQILPTLDKRVAQQIVKLEPLYRFMEIA